MTIQHPLTTVGGLVIAQDGSILLVRSHKWNDLWTVPGGKVKLGETRDEAFIREILEETALHVTDLQYAFCQDSIYNTQFYRRLHFVMHDYISYLAEGSSKESVVLNDEAEEYRWVTLEEAKKADCNREVYLLLEWYEKHR